MNMHKLVSEGVDCRDVDNFIDTGSYIFNALLSGSIYGGLPIKTKSQQFNNLQQVKHFL